MSTINIISLKDNMLTNSVSKFIDILTNNLWNKAQWHVFVCVASSKKLRFNKNFHGGSRLVSIRDDILCNLVKPDQMSENVEDFFIESELCKKKKQLLGSSCNRHKSTTKEYLSNVNMNRLGYKKVMNVFC